MELKITQIKGSFHYVRYKGDEYIIHNCWISPRSYFLGKKSDKLSIFGRKVNQGELVKKSQNPRFSLLVIAIIIQPVIGLLYRFLAELFNTHYLGGNLIMKLLMFGISSIVAFIIYKVFYYGEDKRYQLSEISKDEFLKLTFKTDGKRRFGLAPIFIILNTVTLIIYLLWDNPQSGTFLILTTLFFFAMYVFSYRIIPIGVHHQLGYLIFEEASFLKEE